MGVHQDTGPVMAPRWKIYSQARELRQLADLAASCAVDGPGQDLPRARGALDRMRAVLGDEAP